MPRPSPNGVGCLDGGSSIARELCSACARAAVRFFGETHDGRPAPILRLQRRETPNGAEVV
jgi:hypothetical protein